MKHFTKDEDFEIVANTTASCDISITKQTNCKI